MLLPFCRQENSYFHCFSRISISLYCQQAHVSGMTIGISRNPTLLTQSPLSFWQAEIYRAVSARRLSAKSHYRGSRTWKNCSALLYTSAPGSRESRWSSLEPGIDFETIGPLGGHCAVSAFGALGPLEGLNLFHEDAMVGFSKSKSTRKPFTLYFRFIFLSRRTITAYRLNVALSL